MMQSADVQPTPTARLSSIGLTWAAGLALTIGVALFWWLQLLGGTEGKAFDSFEYHYPSYVWLYDELAQGRLPLWNPYQLCGIPTLATLQSGVLYPPHLLHLLLPTDLAMAMSGLLHLLLIAISTWLFCLRAGLSMAPSLVAALLVATRGAQPGHILNPSMQEAGAWLAVGFIGVLTLARGRPLRGSAIVAVACGLSLLAGFPQLTLYAAYAWLLVALFLTVGRVAEWRLPVRAMAATAGGILLGAMLAAVVLLPALELSSVGGRERGDLPLHLMLPFGLAGFETPWRALTTALSSRPALPGVAFTFGVSGLALSTGLWLAGPGRRLAVAMAALGASALLFSLGPGTPLFEAFLLLPEMGSFRNPWRALFLADFAIAVTAAIGLQGFLSYLGRRTANDDAGDSPRTRGAALGLALAALFFVVVEAFLAPGNARTLPYDADDPLLEANHQERSVFYALANRPERVFTHFLGDMGDVSEKVAAIHHIRSISDNEILTLRRQREYFTWLYWGSLEPQARNRKGYSQRIFYGYYNLLAPGIDAGGVVARSRLTELAAARYVLVPRSAVGSPAVDTYLRGKSLPPVDLRDRQIVVFEQPDALPRVWLTHRAVPAPGTKALLSALSRSDFDPRDHSFVELADQNGLDLEPARGAEQVRIVVDDLHQVSVDARLASRGLLVLADAFHPGWEADVDGEPTPIYATNHLFRGVVVPAGEHRVTFRYRPMSVRIGAACSLLALVAILLLFWIGRRPGAQPFN